MFYCTESSETVLLRSCNVLKLQLPHRLLVGMTDFEMASALQTQHLFAGDVRSSLRTDGKMGSTSAEAQHGLYGGDNLCAILCFLSAFYGMRGFLGFRATRDAMARVSLQILVLDGLDPCTIVCGVVFCASCAGQVCLFKVIELSTIEHNASSTATVCGSAPCLAA